MWDEESRAQTPIDFAVGAGVFLLTLAFVIAFAPTLFDPFSVAETASPLVSDRVAAGVAGDLLAASPAEPGVLSPACTVAFFESDAALGSDADCHPAVAESPATHFGIDGDVQVVIHAPDERNPSTSVSNLSITTRHGQFDVEPNRTTADPADAAAEDVTVSQRLVSIDGTQYRLTVWVW
ncbi:hypothetical protein FK85_16830 [Halorubrum saccharovorum]|uniref:Uncharacterized protein n=1 Tax=Halorubrum saccharovorum TaxID=2248 RepID=A0A081EWS8_9EURY|nr:hypothetical protein [Halorubrum saccharovorum]KDS91866.1 hypothetical protein FK85_16830 [Halorubrum saccharovorum]